MEGENGGWEWRGLGEYLSAAEVELGRMKNRGSARAVVQCLTQTGIYGKLSESVGL